MNPNSLPPTEAPARHPASGSGLARIASILFVVSGLLVLATAIQLLAGPTFQDPNASATETAFPVTFYAAWVAAALALALTVVSLFVFGFRTRWFWWSLLLGAALWATLPPLGTVLGLIILVVLLSTRRHFAPHPAHNAAP